MPDGPMPESASPPRLLQEFIDRAAAGRYGLTIADVQSIVGGAATKPQAAA